MSVKGTTMFNGDVLFLKVAENKGFVKNPTFWGR